MRRRIFKHLMLAALGWYLVAPAPPPLSGWNELRVFDTAEQCNAARRWITSHPVSDSDWNQMNRIAAEGGWAIACSREDFDWTRSQALCVDSAAREKR